MKQVCFDLQADNDGGFKVTSEYYNIEKQRWITIALIRNTNRRGEDIDIPTKYVTYKQWNKRHLYFRGMDRQGEPVYYDKNNQRMLVYENDEEGYYEY